MIIFLRTKTTTRNQREIRQSRKLIARKLKEIGWRGLLDGDFRLRVLPVADADVRFGEEVAQRLHQLDAVNERLLQVLRLLTVRLHHRWTDERFHPRHVLHKLRERPYDLLLTRHYTIALEINGWDRRGRPVVVQQLLVGRRVARRRVRFDSIIRWTSVNI